MKPLLAILAITTIFFAQTTFAQGVEPPVNSEGILEAGSGFVPCSGSDCSACHFVVLGNTAIKWLITISFLFFAVLAVRAGVKLVISQGNSGALTDAKSSFTNAFIGLVIILVAFLLVDTIMRQLVKGSGEVTGYGPWNEVRCSKQVESTLDPAVFESDPAYTNYHVPSYVSGGATGGSCSPITTTGNPCTAANLAQYFGSRSNEASIICNKESGGRAVNSRTDICCGSNGCQAGDPSFSGGIFQINVLANSRLIPGCTGEFYRRNGSTAQGNCVQRNSRGICTGWSCEITNQAVYNTCMQATSNTQLNLQVAGTLYRQAGNSFQPWDWSRRLCDIP
jgi:hypothetical protein